MTTSNEATPLTDERIAGLLDAYENAVHRNGMIAGADSVSAYHEMEEVDQEAPRRALIDEIQRLRADSERLDWLEHFGALPNDLLDEVDTRDGNYWLRGEQTTARDIIDAARAIKPDVDGGATASAPIATAEASGDPHPNYGPCDGFWPDGTCSECAKSGYKNNADWLAGWNAAKNPAPTAPRKRRQ